MTPVVPRSIVGEMPVYRAGRTGADVARERGIRGAVKLASNESPHDPLPSVRAALEVAIGDINRYPDVKAARLAAAVADQVGVATTGVAVGAGSTGLLLQLAEAYLGPSDDVVTPSPSFEGYAFAARLRGASLVRVPLAGSQADVAAMVGAITERTKVVVIAEPNNPTGTLVGGEALQRLVEETASRCLLVIDEAYVEFARGADQLDAVACARRHPHVVVLRTFSKAHGLAGLRVGYAIGDPAVIAAIDRVGAPFAVNTLAQTAACVSLGAGAELWDRVDAIVERRTRLERALRERGWSVPDPRANFVWLPAGSASRSLASSLEQHGVITRPVPDHGVRVTIGGPTASDRFLNAFASCVDQLELTTAWQLPVADDARFVLDVLDELELIDRVDGFAVDDAARARARAAVADLVAGELHGARRDVATGALRRVAADAGGRLSKVVAPRAIAARLPPQAPHVVPTNSGQ